MSSESTNPSIPGKLFPSDLGYRTLLTDFPNLAKQAFFNKKSTHVGMATGNYSQGCPTLYVTVATQKYERYS